MGFVTRDVQVLDRVIAKAGGEDWWTALSGRVKAQNLLAAYQDSRMVYNRV